MYSECPEHLNIINVRQWKNSGDSCVIHTPILGGATTFTNPACGSLRPLALVALFHCFEDGSAPAQ